MKYLITVLLILTTLASCKSSKRNLITTSSTTEEKAKTKIEILGLTDNVIKIDLSEFEAEITRYEPIYFKQNNKDTVILKPTTYKKSNINKTIQEFVQIDTTTTKLEQNKITQESTSRYLDSKSQGFDIIKIAGWSLLIFICVWVYRKIRNFNKIF